MGHKNTLGNMLIIEVQLAYGIRSRMCKTLRAWSGVADHPAVCPTRSQGSDAHPGEVLESHLP